MLGFTQKEQGVLIFLSLGFVIGLGIQYYQKHWMPLPETPSENMAVFNPPENRETIQLISHLSSAAVSVNRADSLTLQQIPGVGPVLAKRILDFREKNGRIHSAEDLLKIKGIGEKTLIKISQFIRYD